MNETFGVEVDHVVIKYDTNGEPRGFAFVRTHVPLEARAVESVGFILISGRRVQVKRALSVEEMGNPRIGVGSPLPSSLTSSSSPLNHHHRQRRRYVASVSSTTSSSSSSGSTTTTTAENQNRTINREPPQGDDNHQFTAKLPISLAGQQETYEASDKAYAAMGTTLPPTTATTTTNTSTIAPYFDENQYAYFPPAYAPPQPQQDPNPYYVAPDGTTFYAPPPTYFAPPLGYAAFDAITINNTSHLDPPGGARGSYYYYQ